VKKLISIGVALALLTMAVVPAAVAAAAPTPTTYSKIPFAIIGSGFYLLEDILNALVDAALLPSTLTWLPDLMPIIGDWTAGPLGWTVDMLSWGVSLTGSVLVDLQAALTAMGIDLGVDLGALQDLCNTIACGLFQPWSSNISGADFTPCG
jgi:hypothetical protein